MKSGGCWYLRDSLGWEADTRTGDEVRARWPLQGHFLVEAAELTQTAPHPTSRHPIGAQPCRSPWTGTRSWPLPPSYCIPSVSCVHLDGRKLSCVCADPQEEPLTFWEVEQVGPAAPGALPSHRLRLSQSPGILGWSHPASSEVVQGPPVAPRGQPLLLLLWVGAVVEEWGVAAALHISEGQLDIPNEGPRSPWRSFVYFRLRVR